MRAQLLTEVADRGVAVRRSVTELFEAVLKHLEALGREPTTLRSYRTIAAKAGERFGAVQVGKLRASDLDRYYAELLQRQASHRAPRRMASSTARSRRP